MNAFIKNSRTVQADVHEKIKKSKVTAEAITF